MLNEDDKIIRLGEFLRYQRELRGISIEQIASSTKINHKVLKDLEEDNFESLPAKIFVRGFTLNYCKYIGIDANEVLARFDTYLDEKTARKYRRAENALHLFVDKDGTEGGSKTALKVTMITVMILGAIAIAVIKPSMRGKKRHKDKPVTNEEMVTVLPPTLLNLPQPSDTRLMPQPSDTRPIPPPRDTQPITAKITPPAEVKPTPPVEIKSSEPKPVVEPKPVAVKLAEKKAELAKKEFIPAGEVKYFLVVQATEDSWVQYQADDFKMRAFTLRKDQKVYIRARKAIRFLTGNSKGIQISTSGRDLKNMDPNIKLLVLPKEAEAEYSANPFIKTTD